MATEAEALEFREPYVGPRPYQQNQSELFFGRAHEVREITSLVAAQQTLLVFAPSGAGKTSIINAGLIPALHSRFDILPPARLRATANELASPRVRNVYVFNALRNWLNGTLDRQPGYVSIGRYRLRPSATDRGAAASGPTPGLTSAEQLHDISLADYLTRRTAALDDEGSRKPRLVIFDQFEELLTLHPEHWEHRQDFFEQLREVLESDAAVRIVMVIREDYLAQLHRYAPIVPGGLRTRYRLELLSRQPALEAVTKPALRAGRSFAAGVAEDLVDDLRRFRVDTGRGKSISVDGEFADPVQLQVVCRSLWSRLPAEVTEITEGHRGLYGDVDAALSRYYDEAIEAALPVADIEESLLRKWFASSFVTPMKTRNTVLSTPRMTAGVPNTVIEEFARRHVIRADFRAGAKWFELTHDRFIEAILLSNDRFKAGLQVGSEEPDASQQANQALANADEASRVGDNEQALAFAQEALDLYEEGQDPYGQASALWKLAQIRATMQQFTEALQLCDEIVRLYQELADEIGVAHTLVNKAKILNESGDRVGASSLLEKAIMQFEMKDDFQTVAATQVVMASLHAEDDPQTSIELLQSAAQHYQQLGRPAEEANALTDMGILYIQQGNLEESGKMLLRALQGFQAAKDRHSEPVALANLAIVHEARGDPGKALLYLKQARQIYRALGNAHDEGQLLMRMAQLQWQSGTAEKAVATYREAIAIWREVGNVRAEANALIELGDIYRALEEYDSSVVAATEALQVMPGDPRAHIARAAANWHRGQLQAAIGDYAGALEADPRLAAAYSGRGQVLAEVGRFEEALQDLDRALELASGDLMLTSYSRIGRGVAYAGLGRHSRALEEFQASLDLTPANAWTYYNRARAYESMGQLENAVLDYRASLEMRNPALPPRLRRLAEAAVK
jgi:tetratricopeptide (TPR) repeat protein